MMCKLVRDIVKIRGRYTITITKPIRKNVDLKKGQRLEMYAEGGKIVLVPIAEDPSERLAELIGGLERGFLSEMAERISVKEAEKPLLRKSSSR